MHIQEKARKHTITFEGPALDFFEGALLGNGGLGAVVTTRPDAVVIHFGHNNVWDIRIAEEHGDEIGTFGELFERLKAIPEHYASLSDEPWYRDYVRMAGANYEKPYPRPMPCGSLLLGFDRRTTEVLGHRLSIENGLCEIDFLTEDGVATLAVFVDQREDRLLATLRTAGEGAGMPHANIFNRVKLIPDPETPAELPRCAETVDAVVRGLSFRQQLPFSLEDADDAGGKSRAFRLTARLSTAVQARASGKPLEAALSAGESFDLYVALEEGLDQDVSADAGERFAGIGEPHGDGFRNALAASDEVWEAYWSRSGVELEDEFLERIWYRNLYFFQCSVKPEAACPGLFANWSYGKIGAEWHGDYHMNYNTQQPFWVAFSSNHADKHLAYANMVDHVLPVSRKWAQEYYGLRGAYFPHSAYPVEMNMMPYPVPHWGWEVCETPWTVQSLWWHYLYTMDKSFLAERAFGPIKEAVLFMVDYMKRPDASGGAWGDDHFHIFPTVVPELYELTPGFRRNYDCIVDLTLTKFLFRAFGEACGALGRAEEEAELLADVRDILDRFPAYPTAKSSRGTVFVSVPGEDPEVVYNVPNGVTTVFPGEEHGLHSPPEQYEIAVNSYLNHRNEGGNELVFLNLAGARLGKLDLERFKRQIAYCMLPNGTCTDKLLESGGRYSDTTPFDYMRPMGIWFENFALPAVINECLMQSYNGIIRLFPNWPAEKKAAFRTLRAVGGFLVSASVEGGKVKEVEIVSEAGSTLQLYNPWTEALLVCERGEEKLAGDVLLIPTEAGERIRLVPVEGERESERAKH
ncbi:glycoside hydrolase N-terminal domain-containing protein [Paenibacillus sp. LHD-117]|uniref:glycosyl hydrolase family 95 catalytic domain-containing protein n=1 Tax=Paenibacillus sp. LHD-117 TaxID=3071412 RepID=UPI0027DFC88F|nr:glycoside hydrolase N-terminal domain-containing protein [Paenibacillus sp. LHD-117]MDQ6421476.1 glycoside hydrolase N-terminal domain-containing protein [Paenibacillus sp. LHD-117]